MRTGMHFRVRRKNRRGMDAGGMVWFGKEQRKDFGKGNARISHLNQDFRARNKFSVYANGRSSALVGAKEVVFGLGEGQIARLGAVSRSEALDDQRAGPNHLATEVFGNFSST